MGKKQDAAEAKKFCGKRAAKVKKLILAAYNEHDLEASVKDCLTDLRHLADKKGLDFYFMIDSSYSHYQAEKAAGAICS